ncbi:MAG: ethanolamine ammonia-lyase subunit EutC [Candidatus Obscuribacterales bacterium]|nr:ethanolamine ammonia-lyase subunit EutC [Candidatus Obscuribacterales bacterium]
MDENPKRQKLHDKAKLNAIVSTTPARLAVGRVGSRPPVGSWLKFRHDHAVARDAVASELSDRFLDSFAHKRQFPVCKSLACHRADFILNPPKGKLVSPADLQRLKQLCLSGRDVQIVIADGLSAQAVEANIENLLPMLEAGLTFENITFGLPVVVLSGRVAVADQIAHALGARLAINLIGERPGLSSGVGLSAYITYNPGPDTISSHRTVVSNIQAHGTPAPEAGAYIVQLVKKIFEHQVSGVELQKLL